MACKATFLTIYLLVVSSLFATPEATTPTTAEFEKYQTEAQKGDVKAQGFEATIVDQIKANNGTIAEAIEVYKDTVIDGKELGCDITFGTNGRITVYGAILEFRNIKINNVRNGCIHSLPIGDNVIVSQPGVAFNNTELCMAGDFEFPQGTLFKENNVLSGCGFSVTNSLFLSPNASLRIDNTYWKNFNREHMSLGGNNRLTLSNTSIENSDCLVIDKDLSLEIEGYVTITASGERCLVVTQNEKPIHINKNSMFMINKAFVVTVANQAQIFSFVDESSQLLLKESYVLSLNDFALEKGTLLVDGMNKVDILNNHHIRIGTGNVADDCTINLLSLSELRLVYGFMDYMNAV
jgi:hypothetical protein